MHNLPKNDIITINLLFGSAIDLLQFINSRKIKHKSSYSRSESSATTNQTGEARASANERKMAQIRAEEELHADTVATSVIAFCSFRSASFQSE
ncbi:hypothetical protein NPIL_672251 [Nephila pilipes]|uniref:Uncharacterized protein n=1 Tax=Nephila pilipes TaxID=299642 RepID=A0A8X6TMR5_NEPPI|nr:hypothetical protein NPIL_672251 [Nephila pilipes]